MKTVPTELLEDLAGRVQETDDSPRPKNIRAGFDLDTWIKEHRLAVEGPAEWNNGGRRWVFPVCPWSPEHTNRSAYIVQLPDGAISAGCHHNSCAGKDWQALRDHVEPGWHEGSGSRTNRQNEPTPKFKVAAISAAELLRKEYPPGDELVPDLLDKQGALLVSGPQKIGKSHLSTQFCFALAAGQQFLNFQRGVQGCRVLYLQAEMSDRRMQERIRPLAATVPTTALHLVKLAWTGSTIKLDETGGQAAVVALVKEHQPDVLVIDPLMNFVSGDTDKQKDMSRVLGFLDLLRFQFGITVIVVHHHSKKASDRVGGHKALGSVALSAWYESHLILEWHGDPRDRLVKLTFELRHAEAPEPMVLKFDGQTRLFRVQTEDCGPVADVLAAVRKVGGVGVTARQAAKAAGKSESWARKYLDQAAQQGLTTVSDGPPRVYSLPEKDPEQARTGAPVTHPIGAGSNSNDSNDLDGAHTDTPSYGGGDGVRVVEI